MGHITYKRSRNGEYSVLVDGNVIGAVWRAWARKGGEGWGIAGRRGRVYRTRKEAAEVLRRDAKGCN